MFCVDPYFVFLTARQYKYALLVEIARQRQSHYYFKKNSLLFHLFLRTFRDKSLEIHDGARDSKELYFLYV